MFLTNTLHLCLSTVSLAKKAKADRIVVWCKSVVTGHGRLKARQRLTDKLEFLDWDPLIKQAVLYKEDKKVRSIRDKGIERVTKLKVSNRLDNKWPTLSPEP